MKRMVLDLARVGTLQGYVKPPREQFGGYSQPRISDDLHQEVMRCRDEYPDKPVLQISRETGVSKDVVYKMIRGDW